MARAPQAFISSDQHELLDDRFVAAGVLRAIGFDVYQFEDPPAAKPHPAERDWELALKDADIYILLVCVRYSEAAFAEFRLARDLGLPTFVYRKEPRDGQTPDPRIAPVVEAAKVRWGRYRHVEELRDRLSRDIPGWILETFADNRSNQDTAAISDSLRSRSTLEVYTQSLEDRVRFERRLSDDLRSAITDTTARPVMSTLATPTFVTRPPDYQWERQRRMYRGHPTVLVDILDHLKARYEAWLQLAANTQIRWLLDQGSHERYFRGAGSNEGGPTIEQAQAQLDRTISLMETFPLLEVGLQEEPIPTTYTVMGSHSATIFGDLNTPQAELSMRGIRGLVCTDVPTVLRLRLAFELDWERAASRSSRSSVLQWLRSLR